MSETRSSRAQGATYVVFVFLFSSVFYFLMLRAHTLGGGGGLYVTGIMWCPALAASMQEEDDRPLAAVVAVKCPVSSSCIRLRPPARRMSEYGGLNPLSFL